MLILLMIKDKKTTIVEKVVEGGRISVPYTEGLGFSSRPQNQWVS